MNKANPCKFCKTDRYLKWKFGNFKCWVHCDGCGRISDPKNSQQEAGEDWNFKNDNSTQQ